MKIENIPLKEIIKKLKDKKIIFEIEKDFSLKEFYSFLREGFLYGETKKFLFADPDTLGHLEELLRKEIREDVEGDGKHFISPFGKVHIMESGDIEYGMCLIDVSKIKTDYFLKNNLLAIIKVIIK